MQNAYTLLIDSALFVLVCLVQFIIYPSFRYMAGHSLSVWHRQYKARITFFVLPLMLGQLASYAHGLWVGFDWMRFAAAVFISIAWMVTFFKEVPLHTKISQGQDVEKSIVGLIDWNWPRTISWTLVFILSLYRTTTL